MGRRRLYSAGLTEREHGDPSSPPGEMTGGDIAVTAVVAPTRQNRNSRTVSGAEGGALAGDDIPGPLHDRAEVALVRGVLLLGLIGADDGLHRPRR